MATRTKQKRCEDGTNRVFTVLIDMDDTVFDFKGAYASALDRNPAQPFPQSQAGFFSNLDVLPGAVESYRHFKAKGYRVLFVTAPSTRNPWSYTEKRLLIEKWFGLEACYDLVIIEDKSLVSGDVLIDNEDKKNNQDKFVGAFIHFGTLSCLNWAAARKQVDLLKLKYDAGLLEGAAYAKTLGSNVTKNQAMLCRDCKTHTRRQGK